MKSAAATALVVVEVIVMVNNSLALVTMCVTFGMLGYGLGRVDGKRAALAPTVQEQDGALVLKVGPVGVQTLTPKDGGLTGLYYDWAELVPVFNPNARQVLMLGLGGGEMLRVLKRSLPGAALTAVEVDDRVVQLSILKFPMNLADVHIVTNDAARYVHGGCHELVKYDAVIVDVYDGPILPAHFMTGEFFSELLTCLRAPHGMVIMNVAYMGLVTFTAQSMRAAGLADVTAFPVGNGTENTILWAVRKDDWGEIRFPKHLEWGASRMWTP